MSNVSNLSAGARTASVAALVTRLDGGSAAGKVKLYTAGKALLLVTITLNDPAFVSPPVSGVSTISTSPSKPSGIAVANGSASVAVFTDSDNNAEWDGTVTATGGGGAITMDSLDILLGIPVEITGGTMTMPAS